MNAAPVYVPTEKTTKPATSVKATPIVEKVATSTGSQIASTSNQIAAAKSAGSLSTGWMWTMIIVIILAITGWGLYYRELNMRK